ncbi:13551_t:CDS:2 [Ambispora leptoticha]|uniref:13551_t:CDS:1 n=1 Tax=Ambispora leptoticha TaxID=144679 RepID=A0A9N8WH55_9GLOM|nr:13551_t:CDS:2 [Ambispora leptoticha]
MSSYGTLKQKHQTFHNDSFDKPDTIAITATDRFLGNSIVRGLLQLTDLTSSRDNHFLDVNVVALSSFPNDPNLNELAIAGVDIKKTDFEARDSLQRVLFDVDFLIVVPESNIDRVRDAEVLAKAARNQDIKSVIVVSIQGADVGRTQTHEEFRQIEKIWENEFESVVFLSDIIKEERTLHLTLDEETDDFALVNFQNVIEIIQTLVFDKNGRLLPQLSRKDEHRIYNLNENFYSPRDIIEDFNEITGNSNTIDYKQVDRSFLRDLLKTIRDDKAFFHNDPNTRSEEFDCQRIFFNKTFDPRQFLPLRETEIDFIIHSLEFARDNNEASRVTNDVQEITQQRAVSLKQFFRVGKYFDNFIELNVANKCNNKLAEILADRVSSSIIATASKRFLEIVAVDISTDYKDLKLDISDVIVSQ